MLLLLPMVTITKIKQERTNQDRTKIGPFFDFLLNFSIFLIETMFKVSSKNIEKCRRKSKGLDSCNFYLSK